MSATLRKFDDLPLGTRFRYQGEGDQPVWVILENGFGYGKVAKWKGADDSHKLQVLCSAAESEQARFDLIVAVVDPLTKPQGVPV